LRDWWVESDASFDPQAFVLRPDIVIHLASQIIGEPTAYLRTRRAALATVECLRVAVSEKQILLPKLELRWLDKLTRQAEQLPEDERELIAQIVPILDAGKVQLSEYCIP
jgi:methanol--5-hydroxybenzimidazolylcobamide Co-methyltransferase